MLWSLGKQGALGFHLEKHPGMSSQSRSIATSPGATKHLLQKLSSAPQSFQQLSPISNSLCAIDACATEGARVRCVQFSARGNGLEFGFGFGRKRYESIVMDLREDVGRRLCLGQMVCGNDQEHAEEIEVWVISQIVDDFNEFAGSEHVYHVPPARYSDEIPA